MRILRTCNTGSHGWIGAAMVVLLFIFAANLNADDEKDKKKRGEGSSSAREKGATGSRENRTPPAASENRTAPAARDNRTAPAARDNRTAPAARDNRTAPAARDDRTPRSPDQNRTRPEVRDNRTAPAGRENRTPPATLDNRTRPADRENRTPPATFDNRTRPVDRENRTPPATFDNRTRPAGRDNRTPPATFDNRTAPAARDNRTPGATRDSRTFGTNPAGRGPANAAPGNRSMQDASGSSRTRGPSQVTRYPNGRVQTYHGRDNTEARFRSDGRVGTLRTPGLTISRSSHGGRTVVAERSGGRVVVAHGVGRGYVQRPFMARNHSYVQRTYYSHNVAYTRVYRPYAYRGRTLNVYTPSRYYSPGFYGWAYSPWRAPVYYRWGWAGSPWYGYYGGYFSPYPVYSSPALWLTDFLVASTLEAAYQERMAQAPADAGSNFAYTGRAVLSPDVKAAIAREVQQQLEAERAEARDAGLATASDGLPPGFSDGNSHVFVVTRAMDVPNLSAAGEECLVTEGDVLQIDGRAPRDAETADVLVLASKDQDCRKGSLVSVPLQDLVEMQNHMRETIDQGLEELRSKQGQGGLPALSGTLAGAPVQAAFAAEVPPPDQNVAAELQQEASQANQAEQQVLGDAAVPDPGPEPAGTSAPPATIALGQTADEVVRILGSPQKTVDLGAKRIFVYKDLKVTFTDGRVSDVQ